MYICIDLGGTNIRGTWIDKSGLSGEPVVVRRPRDLKGTEDALLFIVHNIDKSCPGRVQKIGLATAGPMDYASGVYLSPTNMPELKDFDVKSLFLQKLNLESVFENDAQAAALGETFKGCLAGEKDALVFTLGTGLGSGVIMGGKLWKGNLPAGPELGHLYLGPGRKVTCGCGQVGCAETWLNARALLDLACQEFSLQDLRQLTPLLEQKNPAALKILGQYGHRLGLYLSQVVSIFGISSIGLSGGLSRLAPYFLPAAEATVQHRLGFRPWLLPDQIRHASDPEMSALWGMGCLMIS
ncbi:MAG: ROK family protein [Desulfonatronovibrionaceae bacterium]